jgi:hypothetical protein
MQANPSQADYLLTIISEELAALEVQRTLINERTVEYFFDTEKYHALARERAENFGAVLVLSKIRGQLEGMIQAQGKAQGKAT